MARPPGTQQWLLWAVHGISSPCDQAGGAPALRGSRGETAKTQGESQPATSRGDGGPRGTTPGKDVSHRSLSEHARWPLAAGACSAAL